MSVGRDVRFWGFVAAVVVFPFALAALIHWDEMRGLVWFLLHQAYYAPLSWLGEPFFRADSEVSFWVLPAGRVLAAAVYPGLLIAVRLLWRWHKAR
jgi:hypothetical protein